MIHNRKSQRLKNYNYSNAGWYFVAIGTKDKKPYLGEIIDGKVFFSEIGKIVDKHWSKIPLHYEVVELEEYIIMPNHLHGIIIINKTLVGMGLPIPIIKTNIGTDKSVPYDQIFQILLVDLNLVYQEKYTN